MRVFFCKYNDPPYVKMEKLEIMVKLASEKNAEQVLSELKEYVDCNRHNSVQYLGKLILLSILFIDMRTRWMWTLCDDPWPPSDAVQSKYPVLQNEQLTFFPS